MTQPSSLLLIEDNPDDVFIMRRALKKSGLDLPVHVATDGKEALDYLRGTGPYHDRGQFPIPSMIFLDLKLPYVDGFEVLEWIRQHPVLHDLEVVILTSSAEERDQRKAREFGVKAYLVKPPKPEMLRNTLTAPGPAELCVPPKKMTAAIS